MSRPGMMTGVLVLLPLIATVSACNGKGGIDTSTTTTDNDGDGYSTDDCNDDDPAVYPGAEEVCDGIDNNCNGELDDGVADVWYPDSDGDGFGDAYSSTEACSPPAGHVPNTDDCDDSDETVFPGAVEYCDGRDNDCDGIYDTCRNLDQADGKVLGSFSGDQAGYAVAGPGDVDGDGFADLLVGSPDSTPNGAGSGMAYLIHGPASGEMSVGVATARFSGLHVEDQLGYSLSPAGDMNADGFPDLFIGAWGDLTNGATAGAAFVYLAPVSGDYTSDDADITLLGESAGDSAGIGISAGGDVDGDGWPDLLIGAKQEDTGGQSAGAAYIIRGPLTGTYNLGISSGQFHGAAEGDYSGDQISSAGDVDGDGLDDVLIGAWGSDLGGDGAGAAYLVSGPASGVHDLSVATAALVGEADGDHAGWSIDGAGDINEDGYADVLVGAIDNGVSISGAGAAYLVHGPLSGQISLSDAVSRLQGSQTNDHAGNAVASAGDANGDAIPDVLIGAFLEDSGGKDAGAVYLMLGPFTGTRLVQDADAGFLGEAESDRAAWSLAGPGDLNGDGHNDIAVGAPQHDLNGDQSGAAYTLFISGL